MGKLGVAIAQDIEMMLSGSELEGVLSDVANLFEISAEEANRNALDPDGSERFDLTDMYAKEKSAVGKNPKRDQDFTGRAKNNFDWTTNTGSKKISYEFPDPEVDEYMSENYYGVGKPEARFFPEEKDMKSSIQLENTKEVEQIIEQHLNQDRLIKVDG